jgi:hypothetical protein
MGVFLGLGALGRYSLNANGDLSPEHDRWLGNMAVDYEVVECSEKRPDGRRVCTPCEFERLERQLTVAAPVTDKIITYQYQGLMSKRPPLMNIGAPRTDALYDGYVKHRTKHL